MKGRTTIFIWSLLFASINAFIAFGTASLYPVFFTVVLPFSKSELTILLLLIIILANILTHDYFTSYKDRP